ncbi:unnamed protein product [Chrysoparadoxa australica]
MAKQGKETLQNRLAWAKAVTNFRGHQYDGKVMTVHRAEDTKQAIHDELYEILETNMRSMYEETWGWDAKVKRAQMEHPDARFLVVREASESEEGKEKEILAFSHFRFTVDDDDDPKDTCLYIYELQVKMGATGKGLGKKMMEALEEIAHQYEMSRCMLTVFKCNKGAMRFYMYHLNYQIDPQSPSQWNQDETYEILSKGVS